MLPTEGGLTPLGLERVVREAVVNSYEKAAEALSYDWYAEIDGKQVERWAMRAGTRLAAEQDMEAVAVECGKRPAVAANAPDLLVIGVDGGRVQMREKDAETGSRWRENKVVTVSTYLRGEGEERKPEALVSTQTGTMKGAMEFGRLAKAEALKRGLGRAEEAVIIGDCGNWIDSLREREFEGIPRIADWYHVKERLYKCGRSAYPDDEVRAKGLAERWVKAAWEGRAESVAEEIEVESTRVGAPQADDGAEHPRRVLAQGAGYFRRNGEHMRYPEYRWRGWPVGSGVTEAGVKQMNKRVKGTEQCWSEEGVEAVMRLRGLWLSQDGRWQRYWQQRPAYMDCSIATFKDAA